MDGHLFPYKSSSLCCCVIIICRPRKKSSTNKNKLLLLFNFCMGYSCTCCCSYWWRSITVNKEIHFIHQCSVADDDDDDADAARNEAIVKGSHRGASLLARRSSADRMRNLFASTQKWQIVHHEVNRACTRIRDCWAVVPATRGWRRVGLAYGGDLRNDTFYCRPLCVWLCT